MEKSIYSHDYSLFLGQLRKARESKSLTQAQVTERLRQTQSFVSKIGRGERRLDVVELRAYCAAIESAVTGVVAPSKIKMLEARRKWTKKIVFSTLITNLSFWK